MTCSVMKGEGNDVNFKKSCFKLVNAKPDIDGYNTICKRTEKLKEYILNTLPELSKFF